MSLPMQESPRYGRIALAYAARGWFVFPLRPQAKEPLIAGGDGFKSATTDPDRIRAWWAREPAANIGLWPGPSGLLVVDIDGPTGEATAQRIGLLAEPTMEVSTGRTDGGRHRYYRRPAEVFVGNAHGLGDGLDVRGHNGYVVVPPSRHPSGRLYAWVRPLPELGDFPAHLLPLLGLGASPDTTIVPTRKDVLPAWMIPWLEVPEGDRNNTLTRFVGWAYQQGHDEASVLAMALGVNGAWQLPVGRREVEAIVRSIGAREARRLARTTSTGHELTLADETPVEEAIRPARLASTQVEAAFNRGRIDLSGAPTWFSQDMSRAYGPMLPGELIVVGALMGNGKTSFLLSQLEYLAARDVAVLYLPLEVDPADVRRRWAAWSLGYEWRHVARNEWDLLPSGAREAHEAELIAQGKRLHVQFPGDKRVTLSGLAKWVRWGVEELRTTIVMIDHFHRLDFGGPTLNYRVMVTEAVRAIKDLARDHQVTILAAAQLNQTDDFLDRYYAPVLRRLKESAGIGEEADAVFMLSRRLKKLIPNKELKQVRAGHLAEREYEDSNVMVVTCRKHRLDDTARDRSVRLVVSAGRVLDQVPTWLEPV